MPGGPTLGALDEGGVQRVRLEGHSGRRLQLRHRSGAGCCRAFGGLSWDGVAIRGFGTGNVRILDGLFRHARGTQYCLWIQLMRLKGSGVRSGERREEDVNRRLYTSD